MGKYSEILKNLKKYVEIPTNILAQNNLDYETSLYKIGKVYCGVGKYMQHFTISNTLWSLKTIACFSTILRYN